MMAGLASVVDELAAMLEPLRLGRRRPRLTLVEHDGKYECYRNRRRPLLLSSGDIDKIGRGAVPREMLSRPIEVRLDSTKVLTKILQLPAASRTYLDAIVTHQLERTTPWAADRIVYDYVLTDDDSGNKDNISVRLVAIARDAFESVLARLRAAGLKPATVGTSDDPLDKPSPINLLGVSRAVRRQAARRTVVKALVAVLVIGAAASAYTGWRLHQARTEEAAVQADMDAARAAIARAIANTQAAEGFRRLLAVKEGQVPMVSLVDTLSSIIPKSTYLAELTVDGEELRVVGFSDDAPALIGMLEDAEMLDEVKFGAPTTREEGATLDRFEIVARIVSAVPAADEASNPSPSDSEPLLQ